MNPHSAASRLFSIGMQVSRVSQQRASAPINISRTTLRTVPNRVYVQPSRKFSTSDEAVFNVTPFKVHKLDKAPDTKVKTSKSEMMGYLRAMTYYRRLEIVADTLYKERMIRGFCHLYDGQEAVTCGMESGLKKGDSIITAYRDHVTYIGRGGTGEAMLAELMGKATGCTKGKGGSMHMYHPEKRFYGGNGIVGAQIPVGAGLAFAHKYRKDGGVAVAMMGDGAANQGQVFEAANMAALWKLPCIFLVENNLYGMGTSSRRASANPDFFTRGDYVPGLWIDGMDVLAVKQGISFAADYCRSGKGPIFVELSTYRYHGHSMSDPGLSYRDRDEVSKVRAERDCIDQVKKRLLDKNWTTAEEIKEIEKAARVEVDKHAEFAKNSPVPAPQELYSEIFCDSPPPFIRLVEFEKSVFTK